MAGLDIIGGSLNVQGNLSAGTFSPPNGCINNAAVATGATGNYIDAAKIQHRNSITIYQSTSDAVQPGQSGTMIAGAGGTVRVISAIDTVASGGHSVTIDLQRSTAAGAFSSVLSSPTTHASTSTAKTSYSASVTTTTAISGDIFRLVVTTTGSTTNGNKGLWAVAVLYEEPQ